MNSSIFSTLLRQTADMVDAGYCGLDDDEMRDIADLITHYKVTLEQVCHRKGFSRATLDRRIQSGQYPEPRKDAGGKKYYYWNEIKDL